MNLPYPEVVPLYIFFLPQTYFQVKYIKKTFPKKPHGVEILPQALLKMKRVWQQSYYGLSYVSIANGYC